MDGQTINRAVARLSLVATEDVSPEVTLVELCDLAAQVLDVDGAGVMVTESGLNRYVHATTAPARAMERAQEVLRSGPCRDAAHSGGLVMAVGDQEIDHWSGFAPIAAEVGIGAIAAVPLMSRARCWGVLDLYRRDTRAWQDEELAAARLLADVATAHVVMAHDRDSSRLAESRLAHVSSHDPLTQVSNRVRVTERLARALASAPSRGCAVGVIFADLDRFKNINDTFGHRVGDVVLQETARRLGQAAGGTDDVGRLAGDEFIVVCDALPLTGANRPRHALDEIAGRIEAAMAFRFELDVGDVAIDVSLGAAVSVGRITAEDLIHEADMAMYQAKGRTHPQQLTVRDFTADHSFRRARTVEHDLVNALERGEFEVHFQPVVRSDDPTCVEAVEALLRWHRPDGAVMPADTFIRLATAHGLMPAIGGWVIDQVASQMARWAGEAERTLATAWVNLSPREIADPSILETLHTACERHQVPAGAIGLEIVEESFRVPGIPTRLGEMRAAGHRLSIDDFGTGYSSVSRLLDLEVDTVKIDRAVAAGTPADPRRRAFVDAVVGIASSMRMDIIAEGVETRAQQDFLAAAGCTHLQGARFGRPQPSAGLTARLLGAP